MGSGVHDCFHTRPPSPTGLGLGLGAGLGAAGCAAGILMRGFCVAIVTPNRCCGVFLGCGGCCFLGCGFLRGATQHASGAAQEAAA